MKKTAPLMLLVLLTASVAMATVEPQPVRKVESSKVCMINEQYMDREQIPVEADGKTYYGCCQMCVDRITNDPATRFAVDPVSKAKVDKAKAVIGATEDGKVFYFETEKNLGIFNDLAKKK